MSPRDWLEIAFHAWLLLLCSKVLLLWLADHRWARVAFGLVVGFALVYHVAVTTACHSQAPLCYWNI